MIIGEKVAGAGPCVAEKRNRSRGTVCEEGEKSPQLKQKEGQEAAACFGTVASWPMVYALFSFVLDC